MIDTTEGVVEALMEDEGFRAEYRRHLLFGLIYGRQGFGKNMRAAAKLRDQAKWWAVSGERRPFPQKICNYQRPKVYWFGELHGSNNFIHNEGFSIARHWDIKPDALYIRGANPNNGTSIHIGDTVEEYKSKRFIGVSEPPMGDAIDNDFLMKFTGDDWVETKTLNRKSSEWKPQGKIFIASGQPLRMHNEDKETIERVKEITYTEAAT